MKLRKVLAALLAAVMVLSLAACGGSAPAAEAAPAETAAASSEGVGDHDQNMVIALNYDLGSFDTAVRWATEDYPIYSLIYARLFEYDEDTNPIPALCVEETHPSDLEVQYKIAEGVKFSDGTDLTAKDVAASILYARDSNLAGELLDQITDVTAVDDYTILVKTATSYPQIDIALADPICSILSADFIEKATANPDLWQNPVCSGRYTVESRVTGSEIKLVANPGWYDDATKAQNDTITFKIVPEGATRTIMVQTGEADLAFALNAADVDTVEKDPNVEMYTKDSLRYFYLCMNVNVAPFDNKLVRQAMNYAIDRDACLLIQEEGHGQVVYDYVAPACMGYMGNPGGFKYDPEKAKELLKEAGVSDLTVELSVDASFNSTAALIQAELAEVGITCNIVTVEQMVDLIPLIDQDKATFTLLAWNNGPEDALWEPCLVAESAIGANNFAKYTNPEIEASFPDAYDQDPDVRMAVYHKWQEILADDCPWVPLYVNEQMAVANKDLKGVEMCACQPYNLYKLTYK